LVTATAFEARLALRSLGAAEVELTPDREDQFLAAPLGPSDACLVATGVGLRRAREGLEAALDRIGRVDTVIGFGFAGGLVKSATAGRVVLPTRILDGRSEEQPTDVIRMSLARGASREPLRTLWTSGHLIPSPAEKAALYAATGAEAVDMESAEWGKVCRERGIPWAVVRSILDPADEGLPESFRGLWDAYGRPLWGRVIPRFLVHPEELVTSLRIGRVSARIAGPPMFGILRSYLRADS
jgi:nucleoside phosphorylase